MSRRRDKNSPIAPVPSPVANLPGSGETGHDTATASKHSLFPQLPSLSRIMSVVMLIVGIFAVGVLFYRVMAGFFIPLFLAALLVVIFRPAHDWIEARTRGRTRIAALGTTLLIMLMVLIPMVLVISVAATQFTAMIRQVGSHNVTEAIDRVRERFGLSLPHPEEFRRIDELADTFDDGDSSDVIEKQITEAISLLQFLQENVPGPPSAEPEAALAEANLVQFLTDLRAVKSETLDDSGTPIAFSTVDKLDQEAVVASASIRSWMHTLLGGTFRSQLRLIPTPSESDFANLIRQNRAALQPRFVQVTSATGGMAIQFLIGLGILIISVYFFLVDGPTMIRTLMRLSPLDDDYERCLLLEFDRTSRAVVLASVLSALAQGVLATIGYYFAGLESLVLLFLLTSLMGLVPFLGAASVWIPCALWLGAVEQRFAAAISLAIFGMVVISSIDNVIKVFVLHGRSQLHPLFALLSVLGGVQVFGPIGIVVGPMVVVFLQTLLEILNHELGSNSTVESTASSVVAQSPPPASEPVSVQ